MTLERQLPAAVSNTSDRKTRYEFAVQIKVVLSVRTRIPMFAMILTSVSIVAATAQAGSESLKITDAWVPAAEKSGGDVPLLMTIRNDSSSPDALMRVRCAAANFRKSIPPRRRGACDTRDRIYPARSRQHHHAQARRISRDVAADAATRHRLQIHVFDRFSKGWNDRKGGAGSLVTLNVVARRQDRPQATTFHPKPVPDRRPTS